MVVYLYLLIGFSIFVAVSLLLYLILSIYATRRIFLRGKEIPLSEVDLSNTHYAQYRDKLVARMEQMQSLKSKMVETRAIDGKKLVGYYYDNNSDKTVVLVHGYRATAFNNCSVPGIRFLQEGYNVLLVVNRAHGKSDGKLITFGYKERFDMLSWADYVDKNLKPKSLVFYGISMGGASVANMVDKVEGNSIKAVAIDCAYISAYEIIKYTLKRANKFLISFLPGVCFLSRVFLHIKLRDVDCETALNNAKVPVFFIHGEKDKAVPISHGRKNFEACSTDKEFCVVEESDHAACFLVDEEKVASGLFNFLNKYVD